MSLSPIKLIGFGIVNYAIRFAVGGFLFLGLKMNPTGFLYGFLLTLTAFVVAYLLMRFFLKPKSKKEAFLAAGMWILIAFALDAATAEPIVRVPVESLFREPQTWTRALVILLAAPFAIRKPSA
jgi:short subunit fatty acids transporter